MTCYSPVQAWRGFRNSKGNYPLVFKRDFANFDYPGKDFELKVPCCGCVGCRLDYSREWAIRCMHEADISVCSSFITLTYSDNFLPLHDSLHYDDWTRFLKRLRRSLSPLKIRFYATGEYGDKSGRPHYHALIFGYDFPDRKLHTVRNGYRYYTSEFLSERWTEPGFRSPIGNIIIGDVTFESAAYVARYMMKKVKGEDLLMKYWSDPDINTGEIFKLQPEKALMSRMPGLGKDWFDKFHPDVYHPTKDIIVLPNGKKCKSPKFYDKLFLDLDPDSYEIIKQKRVSDAELRIDDSTPERLNIRRLVKESKLNRLLRCLE